MSDEERLVADELLENAARRHVSRTRQLLSSTTKAGQRAEVLSKMYAARADGLAESIVNCFKDRTPSEKVRVVLRLQEWDAAARERTAMIDKLTGEIDSLCKKVKERR